MISFMWPNNKEGNPCKLNVKNSSIILTPNCYE